MGSVLLALEGLLSETESECSRLSEYWPVGLCPVLSSKVIERTAKLDGCGLARGFGLGEEGCKYTA